MPNPDNRNEAKRREREKKTFQHVQITPPQVIPPPPSLPSLPPLPLLLTSNCTHWLKSHLFHQQLIISLPTKATIDLGIDSFRVLN